MSYDLVVITSRRRMAQRQGGARGSGEWLLRSQDNSHPVKPESHGVPEKVPTGRASYLAATTQIAITRCQWLGVLSRVSLRPRPGGIAGQIDRLRAQGVDLA